MAATRLSATVGFVEPVSFHKAGNAFAMTRIVKQPGVSGTPRPYRRSPAKYRAPASSTSARNARHASWDNSDAASANGFAGV